MTSKFRRILVALDLSAMDREVLRYVAAMCEMWDAEKLYFLHIMPDFNVPTNADVEFHKLFSSEYPVDEKIRDKLALDVQEFFDKIKGVNMTVEVVEGKPYDKLLHWIEVKEIDLLVVGHKQESEGSGITPRRIARRAKCNVLFVPEGSKIPNHILVPIDFSDNSERALQFAVDLSHNLPDADVQTVHIIEIPPEKYYMRSAPTMGFRAVLVEAAKSAYDKMLKTTHLSDENIKSEFIEDGYVNIATHISDYVGHDHSDLIIIGAQGHTAFEKFLYGSVTERLVEQCKSKPIMVIR